MGRLHNQQQTNCQNRNHNEENQCQLGVNGKGKHPGTDQHDGAAHRDADNHHKGHLHVGHIGGQTGDDTAGGKFINVGKRKLLYTVVHFPPQIAGKAGGRPGGKAAGQCAQQQGHQRHEHNQNAILENAGHIARLDTLIQQLARHHGNQHVKGHFTDHEDGGKDGVQLELLNAAD